MARKRIFGRFITSVVKISHNVVVFHVIAYSSECELRVMNPTLVFPLFLISLRYISQPESCFTLQTDSLRRDDDVNEPRILIAGNPTVNNRVFIFQFQNTIS